MIKNILSFLLVLSFSFNIYADCSDKISKRSELSKSFFEQIKSDKQFDKTGTIIAELSSEVKELPVEVTHKLKKYIEVNRAFVEKSYSEIFEAKEELPNVWFYPASGFDLATMVALVPDVYKNPKTFIMLDATSPFVRADKTGEIPQRVSYGVENLEELPNGSWGMPVTHVGTVRYRSEKEGMLSLILERMYTYFGKENFNIEEINYYKNKNYLPAWKKRVNMTGDEYYVHGQIKFNLGENTPTHELIYIHGSIDKYNDYIFTGELAQKIDIGSNLFNKIDGIFIQGSQGIFTPLYNEQGLNTPREHFLNILAKNRGILIEGKHNHPAAINEPLAAWEVTQDAVKAGDLDGDRVIEDLVEDSELRRSYYDGARVTRWKMKE